MFSACRQISPSLFQRPREDWVEKTYFLRLSAVRRVTLERQGEIEWRVERPDAKARIMDVPRGIEAGQLDVDAMAGTLVGARALNFLRWRNSRRGDWCSLLTAGRCLLFASVGDERVAFSVKHW